MLIFSQVLLSMQLAFAVIPLIHFVSDRRKMGNFTISTKTKLAAWLIAIIIVVLNLKLVMETVEHWMGLTDSIFVKGLIILGVLGILFLLAITLVYPLVLRRKESDSNIQKNTVRELMRN